MYHLLQAQSTAIQAASFTLLHCYIPTQQEQVSIEAALLKQEVFEIQLPGELLSLVLEASHTDFRLEADHPELLSKTELGSLMSYLLSWALIFDHFQNSVQHTELHI